MSTSLFSLFINDIVDELRLNTVGIRNNFFSIQCLLYADDLVFLSESEIDLQVKNPRKLV